MHSNRKKEIRIFADQFREKCKVSKYGIIDLFKECDRMGYKLIRYPLENEKLLGFTMIKEDDTIIFTNSISRLSREIFTLAHEIGHIKLHLDEKESFIDDEISISERNSNEKEKEANYFAACLLMPDDEISKFIDLEFKEFDGGKLTAMDIAKIMSVFNVSFEMTLNRLEELEIITLAQRHRLDSEKNKKHVGHLLKSVGGNSKLNIPTEEISIPYEYIKYVIYNYNHKAIPRETLEKVLEYYQLNYEDIEDEIKIEEEPHEDLDELIGGLEDWKLR